MPYSTAITMIDDLPPMVQLPTRYQQQQPLAQQNQYTNTYYEEVIKEHPTIQSKIRPTEVNPFAKYEETLPPQPFHPATATTPTVSPSQPNYLVPKYPLIGQPPASVGQSYMSGNMIPNQEVQHLPIAEKIATHYDRPISNKSLEYHNYPTVENYLSCRDVMEHVSNCPICKNLYHKNDRLYMGIIAILALLIFIMVYRFSSRPS